MLASEHPRLHRALHGRTDRVQRRSEALLNHLVDPRVVDAAAQAAKVLHLLQGGGQRREVVPQCVDVGLIDFDAWGCSDLLQSALNAADLSEGRAEALFLSRADLVNESCAVPEVFELGLGQLGIFDSGSLWGASGVDGLPEEETVVEQYWGLAREAASRGFEHYEISNYARPGFRSRHNQIYWRAAEYLACGPGACGFVGDVRYGNVKPVARYCAALEEGALPIDTFERLTARQQLAERLILGLRLADGLPRAWLDERLAGDAALARRLAAWRENGFLVDRGPNVALTEAGFLVSDALFVELL